MKKPTTHWCCKTLALAFLAVNLTGANFAGAALRAASFHTCNFKGSNIANADFEHSCFVECNLANVDLSGAKLTQVTLKRCDLTEATLNDSAELRILVAGSAYACRASDLDSPAYGFK